MPNVRVSLGKFYGLASNFSWVIILGPYNFILVLVTEFGNTANGNPSVHLFIKPRK